MVYMKTRSLGFEACRRVSSPGVKCNNEADACDGGLPNEEDHSEAKCAVITSKAKKRKKVMFSVEAPVVVEVPAYSGRFKLHPRDFLLQGPIGDTQFIRVPQGCCRFTGVSPAELAARKAQYICHDALQRSEKLLHISSRECMGGGDQSAGGPLACAGA